MLKLEGEIINNYNDVIILIPAYNPQNELVMLIRELKEKNLNCLIVNDGSCDKYENIFDEVKNLCQVISYKQNMGKGYAIKYGIKYILNNISTCKYFVTADADGQHLSSDIVKIVNELKKFNGVVLGERNLSEKAPLRSRIGNDASRFSQTLSCGKFLYDNQTGLRGFSIEYAKMLISVFGRRYEYEMNVINCILRRNIPIKGVKINTIYKNNNSSSHFRPILDTLRIQSIILRSAWASVASALMQLTICLLLSLYFINTKNITEYAVFVSTLSGIVFAFLINRIFVYPPYYKPIKSNIIYLLEMIIRGFVYFGLTKFFVNICSIHLFLAYFLAIFITIFPEFYLRKIESLIKRKKVNANL